MKEMFSEFVPWFRGTDVHIGVDEYYSDPKLFRDYYNAIAGHVRSLGKHPRAWGSFTKMTGGAEGYDRDVTINCWNRDWYGMPSAAADEMRFINSDDDTLYVVPFADYYHGHGLDNRDLYRNWAPSRAGTASVGAAMPMGSMWAVWNDLTRRDYGELDVHALAELSFPVMAEKNWNAAPPAVDFDVFVDRVARVGLGPARRRVRASGLSRTRDIAPTATISASAAQPGFPAAAMIDREPATSWRAPHGAGRGRVAMDLPAAATVGRIEVERRIGAPVDYAMQVSPDGAVWATVPADPASALALDVFTIATGPVRRIRLIDIQGAGGPAEFVRVSVFAAENATANAVRDCDRPAKLDKCAATSGVFSRDRGFGTMRADDHADRAGRYA